MRIFAVMLLALWQPVTATASPLMYVPTGEANDIVIVDLQTDAVVGRIGELENAHGLAASPGSEFLVAGSMRPTAAGDGPAPDRPAAVSEAEHAAHHAGETSSQLNSPSTLSIIHPRHGHVMRRIAVPALTHHTAVSPDGHYAAAVHSGAGGITVVDLVQMQVVKTVSTGQWPNYAVFSPDGRLLYVSNAGSGTVSEIDGRDWSVRREFPVGKKPEHMVLAPDGATLYIADVEDGAAIAVNLESGKVVRRFEVGADPHGIDVGADGRWLFVSSQRDQRLSRIDLGDQTRITLDLQPAPYHVAYVAAVGKLYVSSRKLPRIWALDPQTLKVIAIIDIGQGVAHQMVVLPQ